MKTVTKQIFFVALLLIYAGMAKAQSLYSSLVEVNHRWTFESDFPSQVFEWAAEDNPIQTHLWLVQQTLAERNVDHLNENQKQNRLRSLAILGDYALKGEFPNNITHKNRRPVFIGTNGNYCAVGHLIKESGFKPLALKISSKMNYDYLLEMKDSELNSWVANSGFTAQELAWIQPGYPPQSLAEKMGEGFNAPVHVIFKNSSQEIMAGGVFDSSGTIAAKGLATWTSGIVGFDWLRFGITGLQYSVEDMVEFNGGIVAAGNIYQADSVYVGSGVAFWDGTKWSEMGSFYVGALPNIVYDVEVYMGELYAAGMFRPDFNAPVQFHNFAKWNGTAWTGLQGSPQGVVYSLELHKGELILGGSFNSIDTVSYDHIAAYDGSQFKQLANGLKTPIYALKSVGDTLFAGGDFLNGSLQDTFGFGYYTNGHWTRVLSPYLHIDGWGKRVECIESTPYGIFLGGDIDYQPLVGVYAKNLLRFSHGELEPFAILDSTVKALKYSNGNLYVGGNFTKSTIGFSPQDSLNHIVYYNLSHQFSLNEKSGALKGELFPNPAKRNFTLRLEGQEKVLGFDLYDLLGKKVDFQLEMVSDLEYNFSAPKLPKGIYILKIQTEKGIADKKIILGE